MKILSPILPIQVWFHGQHILVLVNVSFERFVELADWDHRLEAITTFIEREGAQQPVCQRLQKIPGIGPLSASALWVKLAGQAYQHGRHVAATLGFVPKHAGTGGKIRLRGMSKRGIAISAAYSFTGRDR